MLNTKNGYEGELRLTATCVAVTVIAWLAVSWETGSIFWQRYQAADIGGCLEQALFIAITQALIYGNFVYQFTRQGYLRRRIAHKPLSPRERELIYDTDAPALTILVPSYKEERAVVCRTLLSAALQDFPNRRVVLLVDDPPWLRKPKERATLRSIRTLPGELQEIFDDAAQPYTRAARDFAARDGQGRISTKREAAVLEALYLNAALWIESTRDGYPVADHGDRLFVDVVMTRVASAHRERADSLRSLAAAGQLSRARIRREYRRVAALFRVEITVFERKIYRNLSHEPNKAMNLNSYIGLLGRSWNQTQRDGGLYLEPARKGCGSLNVPAADFLVTLDADSLLVPEYSLILINKMLASGNESMAVAQTPYNAIPGATTLLERIAGATTDIQYLIHQGFTHFGATYWVGANALIRVAALEDIRNVVYERGYPVAVFIKDRTVIEDTESSVDLIARGWTLYNYPERLAFSATPPDFGSLLIQRSRWANGGLLILPKLLRFLVTRPFEKGKLASGFFRIHYLGSITAVNIGLLILLGHSFEQSIDSAWLPLTSVPYFLLYARDLRYSGYKVSDLCRVYALNLLLIPVNLAGVGNSLQQALTRRRVPFGRTPKISGRTAAPAIYVLSEYALLASWLIGFGVESVAGRGFTAAFCLANAVMLAYAIIVFIGLRESLEDVSVAWTGLRQAKVPAIPLRGATIITLPRTRLREAASRRRSSPVPAATVIPMANDTAARAVGSRSN